MYTNPYNSFWKKFFTSKITLGIFLVLIIFIGYSVFKEKNNQQQSIDSISVLQAEMAEFENKNLELAAMVKYLRSNEFVERESREKLNLQKPGEKVIIVPKSEQGIIAEVSLDEKKTPNYLKWWEYFFE